MEHKEHKKREPKLTLSISEAGKLVGTGKDNIIRLIDDGLLGTVAFDKRLNNRRVPVVEIQRFIKDNIRYKSN